MAEKKFKSLEELALGSLADVEATIAAIKAVTDGIVMGSWTPAFSFNTSGSVTVSGASGYYVRVGNLVFGHFDMTVATMSSPVGNVLISLPVSIGSTTSQKGGGVVRSENWLSNAPSAMNVLGVAPGVAQLYAPSATGVTLTLATDIQVTSRVRGSFVYSIE